MITEYIGVIYDKDTKEIRAVINPDYEEQLDDPQWLIHESENRNMLKISRLSQYGIVFPEKMGPGHCSKAVEIANEILRNI